MEGLSRQFKPGHRAFLMELAGRCAEAGGKALLVGGCVRSALLGEAVHDFDVEVFGLQPDRLESLLGGITEVAKVGKAFGIFKLPGWPVDVGLPRTERKSGTGHRGFDVAIDPEMSLAEAARRRDFTLNAVYFDILSGRLEDPLGGMRDLKARILRHCSDRFPEDPLRVLRAMQFAARIPATVAPETVSLCSGLTPEGLSPERYFAEWEKLILKGRIPSRGLAFLEQCRWLRFFPELEAMRGCPQEPEWHPEGDVWTHTLHCMDAFTNCRSGDREEDLVVGFAVLCHDMGKPLTTESVEGTIRSHGHERAGLQPARAFLRRLNVANRLVEQILPLIACHMRPAMLHKDRSSAAAIRRLARDCGRLDLLLRVFRADAAGRPPMADESEGAADWLLNRARSLEVASNRPKPLITGHDLLQRGWKSGPRMGAFLREAYERQLDGAFSDRGEAMDWLEDQLSGRGASPANQASPEEE